MHILQMCEALNPVIDLMSYRADERECGGLGVPAPGCDPPAHAPTAISWAHTAVDRSPLPAGRAIRHAETAARINHRHESLSSDVMPD